MSSEVKCPLCDGVIDRRGIRHDWSVRCPHCHEHLRVVTSGLSMPARVIIVGVLTLALLEGLLGKGLFALVIWTGAMWLAFILIGVLNAILSRLLGFTLEPAGHEGLGESDEPDEPTTP